MGPFCAFLSSVTWAVGSANYSRLSGRYSAFAVNFGRALVALPLFLISAFIFEGGWSGGIAAFSLLTGAQLGWFAISMIASYGLGDVLFLWSTRSLGVPSALAIASSYPLWTALIAIYLQPGSTTFKQITGLVVTVTGVITVILNTPKRGLVVSPEATAATLPGAKPSHRLARRSTGFILAFVSSAMWALNTVSISQGGQNLSPFVGNTVRMFFALVISSVLSRILAPGTKILLPRREYRDSLWLFIFEAYGGSLVFLYGLSHSSLIMGSVLASLAPVLSVPVAWFLGLEKFSIIRTIGICLVVAGVWLLMS